MLSWAYLRFIDLRLSWSGVHHWPAGAGRRIPAQPNAVFWLVEQGSLEVWLDGVRYELVAGQAMLQPSGVLREMRAMEACRWGSVGFRVQWMQGRDLTQSLKLPVIWVPELEERQLLSECIQALRWRTNVAGPGQQLRQEGALRVILGTCWTQISEGVSRPPTEVTPPWLRVALDRIEGQPRGDLTALAAEVGYSPAQFRAKFRDYVGLSPSEYALQCVESKALQLLLETDWALDEIARQLGFQESTHFVRFFKNRHGITPGKFRRQEGI